MKEGGGASRTAASTSLGGETRGKKIRGNGAAQTKDKGEETYVLQSDLLSSGGSQRSTDRIQRPSRREERRKLSRRGKRIGIEGKEESSRLIWSIRCYLHVRKGVSEETGGEAAGLKDNGEGGEQGSLILKRGVKERDREKRRISCA